MGSGGCQGQVRRHDKRRRRPFRNGWRAACATAQAEVVECARILGIENHVVDIHDGELVPSLENRKIMSRLIREWQADIVMGHRPYDYHPDHRYTGVLMDDSAVVVVAAVRAGHAADTPQSGLQVLLGRVPGSQAVHGQHRRRHR